MGCMEETLDLFKKCPRCGEPVPKINIYPFLTLEDWAGYCCSKCKTWVDAFITPPQTSSVFTSTGYEAQKRILQRYNDRLELKMKRDGGNAGDTVPTIKWNDPLTGELTPDAKSIVASNRAVQFTPGVFYPYHGVHSSYEPPEDVHPVHRHRFPSECTFMQCRCLDCGKNVKCENGCRKCNADGEPSFQTTTCAEKKK